MPGLFDRLPNFEKLEAPSAIPRERRDSQSLQIGLCWAACDFESLNETCSRSLGDLALLNPVLSLMGIEWHCLQVGRSSSDVESYPFIRRPAPALRTFADTANLIAGLDAVVTVDTAVCHMSGRLDVPTFLLLEHVPDPQWGDAQTTPWYPSLRLIRQPTAGDWCSVIGVLHHHLASAVVNARDALSALSSLTRLPGRLF
jgi:hypothetical protein